MDKTKICITTLEYPPDAGDAAESVHRIAKMLINSGYEVHVAVFRSKQRLGNDGSHHRASCTTILQNGVFVHQIKSAVRHQEMEIQDFLSDVYFQLQCLHKKYHFDLFHAFSLSEAGYVTTLFAKENDVPVINSVGGNDLHKHIFDPKNYAQIAWVLENSDWVTFASRDLQKRASVITPSVKFKSSAFWNSIPPINFKELPTPSLVKELPGVVIASSGRFCDRNGIEFLLDACGALSKQLDITLLLISDFAENEKLYWQQQVQHSRIGDRLHITGITSRQAALAYLPHVDIFVIPSLHDDCPNTLLEAMLAGRAIIGTRVGAIAEIIEDGVDGLLVNPGNTEELMTSIRYLVNQPQLRFYLGKAANKKALQELTPAAEHQNWMIVYQKVLATSSFSPIPIGNSVWQLQI